MRLSKLRLGFEIQWWIINWLSGCGAHNEIILATIWLYCIPSKHEKNITNTKTALQSLFLFIEKDDYIEIIKWLDGKPFIALYYLFQGTSSLLIDVYNPYVFFVGPIDNRFQSYVKAAVMSSPKLQKKNVTLN